MTYQGLKIGVQNIERDNTKMQFRAGTLAEQDRFGKFRVTCPICWVDMGTMSGETLQRAIMHNLDRGGVMCPECRHTTCDFCGITFDDKKELWPCDDELGELVSLQACLECAEMLTKTRWVFVPF